MFKKNIETEKVLIREFDTEIKKLTEEMALITEEECISDKDAYLTYGMLTRRLSELVEQRGHLVDQMTKQKQQKIGGKDIAQIGLMAAAVIVPAGMTVLMRNSEVNNERIFGRSVAYKQIPKGPSITQIKI